MTLSIPENQAPPKRQEAPKFILTTSWDDGDPMDLRVADYLVKYELPGTFYVPRHNGSRVLSERQLTNLSQAFEVGSHTVNHVDLTSVPDGVANIEISESKVWIESVIGKPCRSFCFPMGRFRTRHVEMARDAGFLTARTVELFSLARPRRSNGIAIVPTTVQAFPHSKLSYCKNLARRFRVKSLPSIFSLSVTTNWVGAAISILDFARERGGIFHLWGHSREIDEYDQWKNLESIFAAMREFGQDGLFLNNSGLGSSFH
jgi:peptidoglycan-N-acetylglucosamine deacetylase